MAETYVNTWLQAQQAEDAAKVEQALAREQALKARAQHEAEAKGLAGALEKCEMLGKPVASHNGHCGVIWAIHCMCNASD